MRKVNIFIVLSAFYITALLTFGLKESRLEKVSKMSETSLRIKIGENELEIKGTEEAVKGLVEQYKLSSLLEDFPKIAVSSQVEKQRTAKDEKRAGERMAKRTGETKELLARLPVLKEEGVFNEPKTLGEIEDLLRVKGWYHKQDMIQKAILRHPELGIKRIKENGKYKYVNS